MTAVIALVAGWLAAWALFMALLEYWAHRLPMHSRRFGGGTQPFENHTVLHHGRYYHGSFVNDPDPAARVVSMRMSVFEHLGLASLLAVPLGFVVSWVGAACLLAVVGLHAAVWTAMHVEMHMPAGRWFSKTRYYRYVRDMHHAHHLHPGKNFAAVFPPFMDVVFGTYHPPVPAPEA